MLVFLLHTALAADPSYGLALGGGMTTEGATGAVVFSRRLRPAEVGLGLQGFSRRLGPRLDAGLVTDRGLAQPRLDVVIATVWPTDRKEAVQLYSWLAPGLDLHLADPVQLTVRGELGGVTRTAEPGWRSAPYLGAVAGLRLRTP